MARHLFLGSRRGGRRSRAPPVHGEEVYDWVVAVVHLLLALGVSLILVALPLENVVVTADGNWVIFLLLYNMLICINVCTMKVD